MSRYASWWTPTTRRRSPATSSATATEEELVEFVVHRSAYHLKEADPHTWAIPRLSGAPKAALVEVQADEYGGGRPHRVHAQLFADTMDALGLDSSYGAYLGHIPGVTLATVNLMSFLGLHRRLRGSIAGHLAYFEMTSSVPNRRYGDALRRLGFGVPATEFFDEHVEADAVHENVAAVDLGGGLARQDPRLGADVVWGAARGARARRQVGAPPHGSLGRRTQLVASAARRERPRGAIGVLAPSRLELARRAEPHELVRPVAERAHAGLAAATQRHRLPPQRDLPAVLVLKPERPSDQERPVAVRGDDRSGVGVGRSVLAHAVGLSGRRPAETCRTHG